MIFDNKIRQTTSLRYGKIKKKIIKERRKRNEAKIIF